MIVTHPGFDPVALAFGPFTIAGMTLGPFAIRWYGIMYIVAFVLVIVLGKKRARENMLTGWRAVDVDDMLYFGVFGVILGGRLGYVLFYKPGYYLDHLLEIFAIWQGGMSFHGGFLGVLAAMALVARRHRINWWDLMDFVAPLVPIGLAAGRLGNFINGELWGRVTDVSWGMVFRGAGDLPRHPSQLYQMALEGLALFALLWWFSSRPRPRAQVSALFLIGYGLARFVGEFAREPDAFLGLLAFGLSMGQWLSLPMVVAGLGLFLWSRTRA